MKKIALMFAGGLLALTQACQNSESPKVPEVVTDTIIQTEVVEVTPVIDSAAITAQYLAEHNKSKGTHQVKHKKQGSKQVLVDSHTPIPHHDAYTVQPVAQPAATQPAATQPATTKTKVVVVHDKEMVYFIPDESVRFPGGERAFDEFIMKNIQYPEDALERHVEGTVYVVMYFDELGNVYKVETPGKKIGYGLEQEAERVVKMSPRWMPAKHAGVGVKSKLTLPVTFAMK